MIKRGIIPTSIFNMPIDLPPLTIENMWENSEFFIHDGEVHLVWKNKNSSFDSFHSLKSFLSEQKLIMGVLFTDEVKLTRLPNKPEVVMSYFIENLKD